MEVEKRNIDYLTGVFRQLLVVLFADFVKAVLEQFAEDSMKMGKNRSAARAGTTRISSGRPRMPSR